VGLRIRTALPDDVSAIRSIYGRAVLDTVASLETEVPTEQEMLARMQARPRQPWYVADLEGAVVGYAYGGRHHVRAGYQWSSDVSVYLADGHRGQGVGRALYERLLPEIRALGYQMLYAGITLPNPASVGLHEAFGFVPVGVYRDAGWKHGQWYDVGWWQQAPPDALPAVPTQPREWQPPAGWAG
jgi:phosphinothricin acetyltransferase